MINLKTAKKILKTYNQEHLLNFYDEISDEQKDLLLSQIENIDFDEILTLYKNSMINDDISDVEVSPLKHIERDLLSKEDFDYYMSLGEDAIIKNQIAVVTMAGRSRY